MTLELASPEAGKIALRGGSADIVVSDWTVGVARAHARCAARVLSLFERASAPSWSSPASPIDNLADLTGKIARGGRRPDRQELAAAAGAMMQDGIDLKTQARVELWRADAARRKDAAGRIRCDAQLLEYLRGAGGRGMRRLASIADLLPKLGVKGSRP